MQTKRFAQGLAIVLLVISNLTEAGEGSFFKYGLAVPSSETHGLGQVKIFSLGYQDEALYIFDYKLEGGMWADSGGQGKRSAGFGGASLGLEPKLGVFYVHSFWGLALITDTDTLLSTPYEFMQDLGIGLRDYRGVGIGLGYKHISNAGIKLPNRGRDFMYIQLQIPM